MSSKYCKKLLEFGGGRGIGRYPGTGTSVNIFFDARIQGFPDGFSGGKKGMWSYSVSQHGFNHAHPDYADAVPRKYNIHNEVVPAWNVDFKTFKNMLYTAFMSPLQNQKIIHNWQKTFERLIPVRTGHLASTILSTLVINRRSKMKTRYFISGTYNYPIAKGSHLYRPYFITNPKHSPPSKGYGNPRGINRQYKVPNVNMLKRTKGGNALYLLNDPGSHSDPRFYINKIIQKTILDIYATVFNNLIMRVTI